MPIQVLDQSTINQIAAGEVVERPASVVKELMENAIDAGSTAITVEIRQGGIGFIRITDNGCGIKKEELPLAFLRHSTSKIRTAEDLLTVSSLGFRGEALSSIAAVSQVELITKTSGSLTGSRYRIEGGEEKGLEEIGAPDGTTFISRNLFFNTPARRKFLKTETTEGAHVTDLVEKIALSHPEISIRLIVNNQSRLHTSGNHNLKDIIYTVYGREIAANLLPVEVSNGIVKISGFIGKPVIARGNRNFENYFINGRYIKSGLVSKAIEDGYKSYMMQHKYPFTLLHLTVEPEFIDVNVHPSKMELRFKDGENMYRVICQAVVDALSGKELIPNVSLMSEREERELEKKETAAAGNPIPGSGMSEPVKNARGPEPFEHRRMEAMGIREERPAYGEKKQKSEWILPPKPLTRELPPERAQAQQPNETGAAAMPAALEEKAPETTGAALAAKKAVPAEKEAPLAEKEALPEADGNVRQPPSLGNREKAPPSDRPGLRDLLACGVRRQSLHYRPACRPREGPLREELRVPKDEGIHLPAREPADHPDTFLAGGGSLKTPHEGVYGHRLRDRAFRRKRVRGAGGAGQSVLPGEKGPSDGTHRRTLR